MKLPRLNDSLTVDSFGGLSNVEIPLSALSLFIGPQASGKSIAAKSIFFCKSYPREMLNAIYEELNREQFHNKLKKKFVEYFRSAAQAKSFFVRYQMGEDYIEVKAATERKSSRHIEVSTSEYFEREFASLRKVYGKYRRRAEGSDADDDFEYDYKIQNNYSKRHESRFGDGWPLVQVFIPAGRSYYSFLQTSIFSLLSSNVPIDPFIRDFGSSYERYKDYFFRRQLKTGDGFKRQLEQVLRGSYLRKDREDYILTPDKRETLVSSSSSGQQEVLPLLVMLQYFYTLASSRGRGVYIEEPEAHLFPDSQHKLIELLAYIFSVRSSRSQLILTTHSPYVCSAANNLLLAGDIIQKGGAAARPALREITTFGAFLRFDRLTAIALSDGGATSITNDEYHLIDTSYLDGVSSDMIDQRERLLALEEAYSNEA